MNGMSLKHVQKTYEYAGMSDPLYATLSTEVQKDNKRSVEEFFATGQRDISNAIQHIAALGLKIQRDRAMDFGCSVGRLSQAMCNEFAEVVGVDISSTMIDRANEYNKFGGQCQYRINTTDDLAQFEDSSFDFVYSYISLQHSPPEASSKYIAEFFRILRPGGVALFQIPSGPRHEPGSMGAKLYSFRHGPFRRFWKRIRGRLPVEMHYIHQSLVEDIIRNNGGRLIDARQYGSVHRNRISMQYCAVRT